MVLLHFYIRIFKIIKGSTFNLDQNETDIWSINIMWCLHKKLAGPILISSLFLGLPSLAALGIHSYTNCYSYYWQHSWITYLRWKFTTLINTLWNTVLCPSTLHNFTIGEWDAARKNYLLKGFLFWKIRWF